MTTARLSSNDVFDALRGLKLPAGEFAIFGSGPLAVRGVIDSVGDLDVLCTSRAWNVVARIGRIEHLPEYDVDIVTLQDGRLSFGRSWGIGEFDIRRLIETAEMIDGLPFVQLEHVVAYKRLRGSDKDRRHLQALGRCGLLEDDPPPGR